MRNFVFPNKILIYFLSIIICQSLSFQIQMHVVFNNNWEEMGNEKEGSFSWSAKW